MAYAPIRRHAILDHYLDLLTLDLLRSKPTHGPLLLSSAPTRDAERGETLEQ
jgi:hypothetical protein